MPFFVMIQPPNKMGNHHCGNEYLHAGCIANLKNFSQVPTAIKGAAALEKKIRYMNLRLVFMVFSTKISSKEWVTDYPPTII